MLPRPESEGEGVPLELDAQGQDWWGGGGDLASSLLTLRRAMVDAATREAERVDTAWQIRLKRSASEGRNELACKGWRLFNKSTVAVVLKPLLKCQKMDYGRERGGGDTLRSWSKWRFGQPIFGPNLLGWSQNSKHVL
jgi:hypothetical protein